MVRVIIGLGNPGLQYRHSRHNVGFWCLEQVAQRWDIVFGERRAKAILGQGTIAGQEVVLAKPRTFVNRSGEAVRYLIDRFHASPQELLVVYDDMDLPLGRLRIRPRGSAGGHNGLKSIIGAIFTQDFPRLRLGIGNPGDGQDEIGFVLGPFDPTERKTMRETIERATEAVSCIIEEGVQEAMNRFNAA